MHGALSHPSTLQDPIVYSMPMPSYQMGPAERAPGKVEARVQYDFIFHQLPLSPFSMLEHTLDMSSCSFWYMGGDFDAVTPWCRSHDVDMVWWRCILSRLSWPAPLAQVPSFRIHSTGIWSRLAVVSPCSLAHQNLGRSSRLADLLDGDLVARPASQFCSASGPERGYGPHLWVPRS